MSSPPPLPPLFYFVVQIINGWTSVTGSTFANNGYTSGSYAVQVAGAYGSWLEVSGNNFVNNYGHVQCSSHVYYWNGGFLVEGNNFTATRGGANALRLVSDTLMRSAGSLDPQVCHA